MPAKRSKSKSSTKGTNPAVDRGRVAPEKASVKPKKTAPSSKAAAADVPPRVPSLPPERIGELPAYLASFTNYEQMKALPADRRQLGPQRAEQLLKRLGLAPFPAPVIQVAGSKGKGSTVLWMEALLLQRGHRPGSYMSPHLERINERIRVGGEEIGDRVILLALAELHEHLLAIEEESPALLPTFFDLWTCMALFIFAKAQTSHALLEVGLGGPLDSTSAVPHEIGVLTSLDEEHRQELGDSLDDIAREKARIARADRPFVIAELNETWGRTAALQARSQGAEICAAPIDHRIPRSLEAPQDRNLAVALATLECLEGFDAFNSQEVASAVESIELAGRLEELRGTVPLLLDSAHTKRSMAYFQRRFVGWRAARHGVVLVGFVDGKDWQDCLRVFEADGKSIDWIVTTPEHSRRTDPAPIAEYLRSLEGDVQIEENVDKAVKILRLRAKQGCALGVTGSFYLSGQVRRAWKTL